MLSLEQDRFVLKQCEYFTKKGASMRVGLLGGTFDPVHNGHLTLAKATYQSFQLDKVLFIPAYTPPHKQGQVITSLDHRLEMLSIAVKELPFVGISDIEISKKAVRYTVETLRELKSILSDDTELFFLVGSDFILDYPTWKEPESLFRLATFVVAARPGYAVDVVPEGVQVLHGNFPNISSTDIRTMVQGGSDISSFVPAGVIKYIMQHNVY